jgi:hypothetical protein
LELKIKPEIAIKSLKLLLPLAELALKAVEKNGGRSHMPLGMINRLRMLRIEGWAEMYLDSRKMLALSLLGIYTVDQLDEIGRMLQSSNEEEQQKYWNELIDYVSTESWIDKMVVAELDGVTAEELKYEFEEVMKVADEGTKVEIALKVHASYMGLISAFYNAVSVMAYGQTIYGLTQKARNGDLNAYYRAFHVDHTISEILCFAELHDEKKRDLSGKFFNALSVRRRKAVLPNGVFKYPKLWFTFAHLDSLGALPGKGSGALSMEELMTVCTKLGIYGADYDRGADDLSKRLQDYRKRRLTSV